MPGPTSFSQSGARGARRIAPISVLPARTLGSPTAGIGTELLAHREKIQMTRPGHNSSVLRCRWTVRSRLHARSLRTSPENVSNLRLAGGEGGIRTLGTGYPVRQISNAASMRD